MTKHTRILLVAIALGMFGSLCLGSGHRDAQAAGPRWRRTGASEYDSGSGSYGQPTLPQGRRYYNGRYFGNFNNRYYGPQYGYF